MARGGCPRGWHRQNQYGRGPAASPPAGHHSRRAYEFHVANTHRGGCDGCKGCTRPQVVVSRSSWQANLLLEEETRGWLMNEHGSTRSLSPRVDFGRLQTVNPTTRYRGSHNTVPTALANHFHTDSMPQAFFRWLNRTVPYSRN